MLELTGVKIGGIYSCVPEKSVDNLQACTAIYGDEAKAASVVKATGIKKRRVVTEGLTSLDLCCAAASKLLADSGCRREDVGAIVSVTFTPAWQMPCNACAAQARLGVPNGIMAFDVNLACSGYGYGLYLAGLLAQQTGKKVLLLDGDTQTTFTDSHDKATVPVLADAGTATLVSPGDSAVSPVWYFDFMSMGEKGGALTLPHGGSIKMDGFGIFKFVAMDVMKFVKAFLQTAQERDSSLCVDAFVPHQANVYMIQQLTKSLKIDLAKLWVSGDELGNSSSATVPTTLAWCGPKMLGEKKTCSRILISGFGGGLSASVGLITLEPGCLLKCFDYEREK